MNNELILVCACVFVSSEQCCDTVCWATGRVSGLYKLGVGLLIVVI